MVTEETQSQFDGVEDEEKTALGFGGKTIHRRLVIGDVCYFLMRAEIVSDGRSVKTSDSGDERVAFKAGAATEILAELDESQATKLAAQYRLQ